MATIPLRPAFLSTRIPASLTQVRWKVVVWTFLLLSILVSRLYLMLIRPILFFDESLYLAQTYAVWERGVMVPWAWNPGVAYLNAIWYSFFAGVPLGLDYASRIATFVCSTATFGVMILIARQLIPVRHWAMLTVVAALASYPFWNVILNSSDYYYGLFALLFLWSVNSALRHAPTHWTWLLTATLIAFSASLRNDGTIVYAAAGILYLWHLWRFPMTWGERFVNMVRIWALPMIVLMGWHWGIAITRGGFYDAFYDVMKPGGTSVSERTYIAFEQGEGQVQRFELEAEGKVWWRDGIPLARELYGTPEKNNHDVFRAIRNNPSAWFNRITLNVRDFFLKWHEVYGWNGSAMFIAGIWGWALLWKQRPLVAFTFLLVFAPASFYFLITFWQPRYVDTMAPFVVLLAMYGLYMFEQLPHPTERRWGIVLAIGTGIALFVFYTLAKTYKQSIPLHILILTIGFYLTLLWRFVIQRGLAGGRVRILTGAAFLLLAASSLRLPPFAQYVQIPYHFESRDYIVYAQEHFPDARVCVAYKDLEALSLVWYAQQTPVPASVDIRADLYNGRLPLIMESHACDRALIAYTGWNDYSVLAVSDVDVLANTPTRILFRSDKGAILLFDLNVSESP